jgi:hypothetical protein
LATGAEIRATLRDRSANNDAAASLAWLSTPPVHAKVVLMASAFVYPVYAGAIVENTIMQYLP